MMTLSRAYSDIILSKWCHHTKHIMTPFYTCPRRVPEEAFLTLYCFFFFLVVIFFLTESLLQFLHQFIKVRNVDRSQ